MPKLLVPDSGELAILAGAGLAARDALAAVRLLGAAEIAFGVALLWFWRSNALLILNVVALVALGLGALVSTPAVFVAMKMCVVFRQLERMTAVRACVSARAKLRLRRRARGGPSPEHYWGYSSRASP